MSTNLASSPQTYRQSAILTASKERLVVLYDGARRFLVQAAVAMREGDVAACHNKLRRAEAIIAHLQNTLDLERGGGRAQPARDLPLLPAPPQRRLGHAGCPQDRRGSWSAVAAARVLERGDLRAMTGSGKTATYEAIVGLAERELAAEGRYAEMAQLAHPREQLFAAPPARDALTRALLIQRRVTIELLRRREQVVLAARRGEPHRRTARGYGSSVPGPRSRRLHTQG